MSMVDEPERERPEGAVETGLWCSVCLLPSACRWEAEIRTNAGTIKVPFTICVDCGCTLGSEESPS